MNKRELKMVEGQKYIEDFIPDGKRIRYRYVEFMSGVIKKIPLKEYEQ